MTNDNNDATTNPNDAQDVDQLRDDIAQTRAEMSETVEQLEERLNPEKARDRFKARAQQKVQQKVTDTKRAATDRAAAVKTEVSRRAEEVPTKAVAGAGAGLASLGTLATLVRRRRTQRAEAEVQRQQTVRGAAAATALAGAVSLIGALSARRRARTVTVRQVMTPQPAAVLATDPLTVAAELMAALGVGAIPVLGANGVLVGMLTDRDVAVKAVALGLDARVVTAGEIAEAPVVTVAADESVEQALVLMSRHAVRRLPVVDGDMLVGVVAQADLAAHVSEEKVGDVVEDISEAPGDEIVTSETVIG